MNNKLQPYEGELCVLYDADAESIKQAAGDWLSYFLTPQQGLQLDLLLSGAFSPLEGFLTERDYEAVLQEKTLSNGTFWPVPVVLDLPNNIVEELTLGQPLALRSEEGVLLAVLNVADIWQADKNRELSMLSGVQSDDVLDASGQQLISYVGGPVLGVASTSHYDFPEVRFKPETLREIPGDLLWYQSAMALTQQQQSALYAMAKQCSAKVCLALSDHSYSSYNACYVKAAELDGQGLTVLTALPAKVVSARDLLLQAIVAQNFGALYFLPNWYDVGDVELVAEVEEEFAQHSGALDIQIITDTNSTVDDYVKHGTEIGRMVSGHGVPELMFSADTGLLLGHYFPARQEQGFSLFFTGLSGAGKSTIAHAVKIKLEAKYPRQVTLLDGDIVRQSLSSELGFSKEHRDLNIKRIGYVASEITKHRGIAICAPIAPYAETRRVVRNAITRYGGFIEVYVATGLEECERRDRKGLYALARAGKIPEFTGISDPYEVPENPEITIQTEQCSPDQAANMILSELIELGYLN